MKNVKNFTLLALLFTISATYFLQAESNTPAILNSYSENIAVKLYDKNKNMIGNTTISIKPGNLTQIDAKTRSVSIFAASKVAVLSWQSIQPSKQYEFKHSQKTNQYGQIQDIWTLTPLASA